MSLLYKLLGFVIFGVLPALCIGFMTALVFRELAVGVLFFFVVIGFGCSVGRPRPERGERL